MFPVLILIAGLCALLFLNLPTLRPAARGERVRNLLGGTAFRERGPSRTTPIYDKTKTWTNSTASLASGDSLTIADAINAEHDIELDYVTGLNSSDLALQIYINDMDTPKETVPGSQINPGYDQRRPVYHRIPKATRFKILLKNNGAGAVANAHAQAVGQLL